MTPKERAKLITPYIMRTFRPVDIERWVEKAITAAVEEDRRARPHPFEGRADRGCSLCGEPDRDAIHCYSREVSKRFINRAIEEEREKCAEIVERNRFKEPGEVADLIRARSNPNASSAPQAD